MKKWLCTFLSTVVVNATACKPETPASDVKFDAGISDRLTDLDLSRAAIEKICTTNPIFVFVGNDERTFAETTRNIVLGSNTLKKTIETSVEDLERRLGLMPIECDLAMPRTEDRISAMLLVITDGPSRNDTKIFTRWYDFDRKRTGLKNGKKLYSTQWGSYSRQYYTVSDDGRLSKSESESALTEIHLPTQLESVVRQAMGFKPPKNDKFKFDQTIYMIKSHGGRFVSTTTAPNIKNYYGLVNGQRSDRRYNHAFLFDGNGPKTEKYTSEIYYPYIKTERACKAIDALTSAPSPSKKICSACKPFIDAKSKGVLGRGCGNTAVAAVDSAGSKTLSPETNDTLSPETNDTLSPETNDTLSPETNDTLSPETNDTLSPETNDTLSPETNDTLSPETNDTLSPEANDTLSAGKSGLFSQKPGKYSEWDEVDQMASAVSYSGSEKTDGLHKMSLPLAGNGSTPPMIVLDSCWGSADIASESFELLGKDKSAVVVLNPNPMGVMAINYGSLDYLQYLMLPYIQAEYYRTEGSYGTDYAKIKKAKRDLDNYLADNGLIGMDEKDILALTDNSKKLEIYFVKDGKARK